MHADLRPRLGQPGDPDLPDRRRLADAGFAGDFTGNGFTDLVVGNNGDGRLALLTGGPGGLSLSQTLSSAEVPNPTGLSFARGLRRRAELLRQHGRPRGGHEPGLQPRAADPAALGGPVGASTVGGRHRPRRASSAGVLSQATSGSVQQVSQLLSLSGTTLDLAATLLTVSVVELESGGGSVGDGRFDRTRPGPGIEPGQRQLRAVRETSRAMKPSQTTGIARRSSSGRRRGSGWRSAWSGPGNGRAP